MNEYYNKSYYLSFPEMRILLYKRQISGLVFPKELTETDGNTRNLKLALDSLIRAELLEPDGDDHYKIAEEPDRWMSILENTAGSILIDAKDARYGLLYIYPWNDEALIIRQDALREKWLQIELISRAGIIKLLNDIECPVMIGLYKRGEKYPYHREEIDTGFIYDAGKINSMLTMEE